MQSMMVIMLTMALVTACSQTESDLPTVKMGSKNFTEALILGEMYALALEEKGYPVERKLNLGGTLVAHESLKNGDIDVYPEYTGTGLMNILEQDPMYDADEVYEAVKKGYQDNWNLVWLERSNANDSQGLVTTKAIAEAYDVYTLSKMSEVAPELRMAAVPEFEDRDDGLKGLQRVYGGFEFASVDLYDYGVKYRVLEDGEADVTVGFTTDGALVDDNFVLLEDDKHLWPPYHVVPVVRGELVESHPEIADIMNAVSATLTDEVLITLNAKVDMDGEEYADVAKEYLIEEGIIND